MSAIEILESLLRHMSDSSVQALLVQAKRTRRRHVPFGINLTTLLVPREWCAVYAEGELMARGLA